MATPKTTPTPTPAPTEDPGDRLAHELFVPQATRDNYAAIARDRAALTGSTPREAMGELAADFAARHQVDPTAGWDHLASWADGFDPAELTGPDPLALAKARATESARRDPTQALTAHPGAVEAAEQVLEARTAATAPAEGSFTPNPGPPAPAATPHEPAAGFSAPTSGD